MSGLLSFDIWGDHAHFKKYYTTTSPLTFEFPPPPTMVGILSAIIGLDKSQYLAHFQEPDAFQLSICLKKPVTKVRWTQNLIDTKGPRRRFWEINNRTQIRIEFLKNAAYRVYFSHADISIHNTLKDKLENHESVYSVSLGLSELLANFEYLGEVSFVEKSPDEWILLDSVLPTSLLVDDNAIRFSLNQEIFKVNYPIRMTQERLVTKREDIIFERNGKPIECKVKTFYETQAGERIVFF
jgi:CRISPR-associated protein Cas5h